MLITFSPQLGGVLEVYFDRPLHSRTPICFRVSKKRRYTPDRRDTSELTAILGNIFPFEHETARGVKEVRVTRYRLLVSFGTSTSYEVVRDSILGAIWQCGKPYSYVDNKGKVA